MSRPLDRCSFLGLRRRGARVSRWSPPRSALAVLTVLAILLLPSCGLMATPTARPIAATVVVAATQTFPAPTATSGVATAAATVPPAPTLVPTPSRPMTPTTAPSATRVAGSPAPPTSSAAPAGATAGIGALCTPAPPFPTRAATPTAAAASGRAPAPPTIPLPSLEADYDLVVDEFDFAGGRLRVAETVRVTNREACTLDHLFFSVTAASYGAGTFTLGAVRVEGAPANAALDGTVLPVRLDRPLMPGASTTVALDFQLAVPNTGGFNGTTRDGDVIRLAYWFPILSDDHQFPPFLDPPYTATADFSVTLTTPANLVVAHTGVVVEERPGADGTVIRRIDAPNVRDFVLTVSPNYQVERRTAANGVVVEVVYSPRNIDASGQDPAYVRSQVGITLDAAVLAQERLSELIGPYPYPVLRVVDAGPRLGGGLEFPMVVWVNMAVAPAGALRNLVYHEVGHEWFYGIIGTRTQQDPWIDEGAASFLASFLAGTLRQNPPGPGAFEYRLSAPVWDVPAGGTQRVAISAIYTQGEAFYTRVYRAMGEEAFWAALRALYREHRFGIITPRDILGAWQAASPVDLRPLFSEYLDYRWIDDLRR